VIIRGREIEERCAEHGLLGIIGQQMVRNYVGKMLCRLTAMKVARRKTVASTARVLQLRSKISNDFFKVVYPHSIVQWRDTCKKMI